MRLSTSTRIDNLFCTPICTFLTLQHNLKNISFVTLLAGVTHRRRVADVNTSDFQKWAAENKLKEATIKALTDEDLSSVSTLQLVDVGLLRTLSLTIGQRTVLEKAVNSLEGWK